MIRVKDTTFPGFDYVLWFDTETFSPTDLKTHGLHRYAEQVQIMMAQWAVDDGPVIVEDLWPCELPSAELLAHLGNPRCKVIIHNAAFDRTVVAHAWGVTLGVERVHCTMTHAMTHSMPGSLDKLCQIMGVAANEAKQANGQKLIQLFCKPLPKNQKLRRATPWTHPEKWAEFLSYGGADITAMRALLKRMPNWNYKGRELELWYLDQRSNERGFRLDTDLCEQAMVAIKDEQKVLAASTYALTNGAVVKATQRDEMLAHILGEYGVDLPDMKKDTLERRINDPELPDGLRQLLRVRLQTTTSSTAKFKAGMRAVSSDGCVRGTTQFCGAIRTGRWGGRMIQPQNFMRPNMTQPNIDLAIEAIKAGCADLVLEDVMKALSNVLRGMIVARPGRKIVAADLEQIESRIAAWLGGEQWKLDAIAEYDTGEGFDNYAWAYAKAFGITPEEVMADKKAGGFWRQVGKVMELALGYEGGVGAWLAFAEVYRLVLEELAKDAYPRIPQAVRTQAEIMLAWRKKKHLTTFGLTDKAFVVIESFKAMWRSGHPGIVGYWSELEDAAFEAATNPNRTAGVEAGAITFKKSGAWLRMILPSGRSLCYPAPKIEGSGRKRKLTYLGVNQYSRKWQRIGTYGGKLFENACQAVSRDVMGHNMPAIEEAGYPILFTVHDEVVTEPLDDEDNSSDNLSSLLATNPPWLPDCPLSAGGFEDQRYRKD